MRTGKFIATLMTVAVAAASAAAPARAQDLPTVEEAMAQVIQAALAPSAQGDWRYGWDAVSIRISRKMHWHLPAPDKPDLETVTRRGWIDARSAQIGVSAHGSATRVESLAFEVGHRGFDVPGPDALLAALAAQGVTVAEIARREPLPIFHTDAPTIVYRLGAPDRDERTLTRSVSCSSPGSAAAPRCSASYELDLTS